MSVPRQIDVSEATPADVPALVGLLGELFAQEVEFTPDPVAQEQGLRAILADPRLGRVFIARAADDSGSVLGMAICSLRSLRPWAGRSRCWTISW